MGEIPLSTPLPVRLSAIFLSTGEKRFPEQTEPEEEAAPARMYTALTAYRRDTLGYRRVSGYSDSLEVSYVFLNTCDEQGERGGREVRNGSLTLAGFMGQVIGA